MEPSEVVGELVGWAGATHSGVAIAGGVSANSYLRSELVLLSKKLNLNVHIPKFEYCTDNAAMIAMAGAIKYKYGKINSRSN